MPYSKFIQRQPMPAENESTYENWSFPQLVPFAGHTKRSDGSVRGRYFSYIGRWPSLYVVVQGYVGVEPYKV